MANNNQVYNVHYTINNKYNIGMSIYDTNEGCFRRVT